MGKPAARLGDMTAHGGTITGPGCPTVLIGGMPAATMGDMHVCPMVTPGTPPIPHVGGPITLGSTGVLIGKKPAARMGDMAVCVGPPSSIVLGCMTVLIGEAGGGGGGGGGGAGGGGGGGGSATSGALISAAIAGQSPQTQQAQGHFLDVTFVDRANLPIANVGYHLEYPTGEKDHGVLGHQIKRTGVPQGSYNIKFRGILNAQWSTQSQNVGSPVDLIIDTIGVDSGTKVTCEIYIRDSNYTDHHLSSVEGQINGAQARISWTLQVDEKLLKICDAKEKNKKFSAPFFFYRATIDDMSEQSGLLYWKDWVEIELKDGDNNPIGNERVKIKLSTGEIKETRLQSNGKQRVTGVQPGNILVEFPDRSDV
jgi:uncharacterized Zn-binding protein involved in type VI secretion